MCLSCDCLCKQCLTGTRRADKQCSFWQLRSDLDILLRIFQKSYDFLQRFFCFILSGNILERHAGFLLAVNFCLALADTHHSTAGTHAAHEKIKNKTDHNKRQDICHNVQNQIRRIIRNLLCALYPCLKQAVRKIRIIHNTGIAGNLYTWNRLIFQIDINAAGTDLY